MKPSPVNALPAAQKHFIVPVPLPMKSNALNLRAMVRLLALAAGLCVLAAHADEPGEVSQLLREGKLTEAQSRLDRHLANKPRDPQLRLLKGVIQRESGRSAEALATFTKLSEDHPDLPEPYNNLAVIYAAQGQYDKARVALEKALRTNASYATAHDNLAEIYARLASQAYGKALQIDHATAPPRLALIRDLAPAPGHPPAQVAATAKPGSDQPAAATAPAPPKPVVVATAPASPKPLAPAAPAAAPPAAKPAAHASAPSQAPAATPPTSATQTGDLRLEVERAVRAWAQAWAAKNMTQYLSAYGKEFQPPGQLSRAAWEEDRRLRIMGKSRISVNLLEMQITVKDNHAVAKFRQDYKADALAVLSRKTLELSKSGGRWLIVKETSGS